jgi:hypothetical protein
MTAADRATGLGPDEQVFVEDEAGRCLAAIEATGCPAPALLRAAAIGVLPDETAAAVIAHVHACGICRQITTDLLELDAELDMLEDARIRRRIARGRRPPIWRAAALAASMVLAVGGALVISRGADPGAAPAVPGQTRPVIAMPAGPGILVADKLEPRIDAAALAWRGSDDRFAVDLAAALKPYAENNFKAATAALTKLATQYPDHAEPALYLGICQLLMDRPVGAEQTLRKAAAMGGSTLEDARWYLAVAVYQNGRRSEARQLLADVCRDNGSRAAEACLAQEQAGEAR